MELEAPETGIASIGTDDARSFRERGWLCIRKLFSAGIVSQLLARAEARMGRDPLTVLRQDAGRRVDNAYGWYARWDGCSHHDEYIRRISHSPRLAAVASALIGKPVRFYFDHVFAKLPARSAGRDTPWHQDLPHHPLDRHGALTMWIALVDCAPEMGSMRFLSGSHRSGLYGRFLNRSDGVTLVDDHPGVLDRFEISPPLGLQAGDATVHDLAVIHHAPENSSDRVRWTYVCQWLPADARYTGAPNHRTDGLGLAVDQPLEHEHFPLIGPDGPG